MNIKTVLLTTAMLAILFGCNNSNSVQTAISKQAAKTTPSKAGTVLTLLGTGGGPIPNAKRAGIASLVTVDDHHYLVDAGNSVTHQLAKVGLRAKDIPIVFITHLHDDHTAGLPALMSFAYTTRSKNMQIMGPPSTTEFMQGALAFLAANADIRMVEQSPHLSQPAEIISGKTIGTGLIFSDDKVRVSAIENTHFHLSKGSEPGSNKSYAYRFETNNKVIVFTGDTGPSEAVEILAEGADILVAEMVSEEMANMVPADVYAHMVEEHLTATEVGKLAAKANVGTLVLSHIKNVTDQDLLEIRSQFNGKVVVGTDLAVF